MDAGWLLGEAALPLPLARGLRREVVNKACLWEADLPPRPPGLSAASSLPPPPLQKPPPAARPPGDHRGNERLHLASQGVRFLCLWSNRASGSRKGGLFGAGSGAAAGRRGEPGTGPGASGVTGKERTAEGAGCRPCRAFAVRAAARRPRFPFLGVGTRGRRARRAGRLESGGRKRFIMEPFTASRWPGARTDSAEASMLV